MMNEDRKIERGNLSLEMKFQWNAKFLTATLNLVDNRPKTLPVDQKFEIQNNASALVLKDT
jgi:hypothetical protein